MNRVAAGRAVSPSRERLDGADATRLAALLGLHQQAFASVPVPLLLFGPDGTELSRSRSAEEWLAGGAAAALPERFLDEVVRKTAESGERQHDVVEVFGPPRRTLSLTGVPLGPAGAPADGPADRSAEPADGDPHGAVLVMIEDTTEWRRAELARRDLVTNISHELRTPVGAIALLAETLAGEDDLETVRRLASRLEGEANRLATMLQDVLALSRLEAAGPGDREPVDLSDLVRFCVARLRATAELAGIELIDAGIDADLTALADRSLLMTAIDNLLDNAVKYSDKGEPVQISAKREIVDGQAMVSVVVRDSGIGIPMRERQRIFERFYRVDRARSRDTGGSGLGLAIVRHVAVVHDGSIDVDSIEGEGSVFTLRVPAAPAPVAAPLAAAATT